MFVWAFLQCLIVCKMSPHDSTTERSPACKNRFQGSWRDLKKLAHVCLCVLTMLDSIWDKSLLNNWEITFRGRRLPLKIVFKQLTHVFVTSRGVYTVKTGIASCFLAKNILLLTFWHRSWWIWKSYFSLTLLAQDQFTCTCTVVFWAYAKIPKMALEACNR